MTIRNAVLVTLVAAPIAGNVTLQTIHQYGTTAPCGSVERICAQHSRHHLSDPHALEEGSTVTSSGSYAWVNPFSADIDPAMTSVFGRKNLVITPEPAALSLTGNPPSVA